MFQNWSLMVLKKKKDIKRSRAWQQFRIVFNPVNNEEVFRIACCCVCEVWIATLQKESKG